MKRFGAEKIQKIKWTRLWFMAEIPLIDTSRSIKKCFRLRKWRYVTCRTDICWFPMFLWAIYFMLPVDPSEQNSNLSPILIYVFIHRLTYSIWEVFPYVGFGNLKWTTILGKLWLEPEKLAIFEVIRNSWRFNN
jgi:hypothetical protein